MVFVAVACACDAPEPIPRVPAVYSDSAGVTIVSNTEPILAPEMMWRLGDRPQVIIDDARYAVDSLPLDPVNAWFTTTGDIVVADGNQAGWDQFFVYRPDGTLRRKIGRAGEGPGEFGQLYHAWPHRGDSLAGFDTVDMTVSVFGPDGVLGREVRLPTVRPERTRGQPRLAAHPLGIFGDGFILQTATGLLDIGDPGFKWYRRGLLRVGPGGQVHDTLGVGLGFQRWWDGERPHMAMFTPDAKYVVRDTSIVMVTGEEFSYSELDQNGRLLRIVRRTYERPPVTEHLRAQARQWYVDLLGGGTASHPAPPSERLERRMDGWGYPERKSAVSDVRIDHQDHIWVEEFRWVGPTEVPPDPEPTTWSVFRPDGLWLGDVVVPPRFVLLDAREDRVLGVHINDLNVRSIVVWPLVGR